MCQLFLIMYFLYFLLFWCQRGYCIVLNTFLQQSYCTVPISLLCFYILEYFLLLANVALSRSILYYNTVISYSLSIHFSPSCYTYTPFCKGSIQFFRSLKHSYETNFLFFKKVRFHEVLTFLNLAISHVCFSCFHQSDKKLHFR